MDTLIDSILDDIADCRRSQEDTKKDLNDIVDRLYVLSVKLKEINNILNTILPADEED